MTAPSDARAPLTNVGFLGAGNLARAMAAGLIGQGALAPERIACIGGVGRSARRMARELGVRLAESRRALIAACDPVALAFKPQHLETITPEEAAAAAGKLVVSALAGRELADLRAVFPDAEAIVRVMPNTPSRIGQGVCAYCLEGPLEPPRQAALQALLEPLGSAYLVEEAQMRVATAIAGCGPALYFQLVAHLVEAAERRGLPRGTATAMAAETGIGALSLLRQSKQDPQELTDEVVSPNGVTHALLESLREANWADLLDAAVERAVERSRQLAEPRGGRSRNGGAGSER